LTVTFSLDHASRPFLGLHFSFFVRGHLLNSGYPEFLSPTSFPFEISPLFTVWLRFFFCDLFLSAPLCRLRLVCHLANYFFFPTFESTTFVTVTTPQSWLVTVFRFLNGFYLPVSRVTQALLPYLRHPKTQGLPWNGQNPNATLYAPLPPQFSQPLLISRVFQTD